MKHTAVAFLILSASAAYAEIVVAPSDSTVPQGSAVTFTVTVAPTDSLQQVTLTYGSESVQDSKTTAPFEFTHTFNTPMDGLTVTATAKSGSGTDLVATADIDVVGLVITGTSAVSRGWPTTFTVASASPGKKAPSFNWTFTATAGGSNSCFDADTDGDGKSCWGGTMVTSGVITCSALIQGIPVQAEKTISISPRNWTTPITCVQDNEPDWGDVPTDGADLGENRDRDSNVPGYVFVPRNGGDFTPARVLATVYTGPCAGLWYVYSSTLKCQRETVINKYIKSTGPGVGGKTFMEVNTELACFYPSSPDDFLQAVMNHEYRGTPDTFKSPEGHQGRTEKCIRDNDWSIDRQNCDAKQHIESLVAWSSADLAALVDETIGRDESRATDFINDEYYSHTGGYNWGDPESLGMGLGSRWSGTFWTGCICGPAAF